MGNYDIESQLLQFSFQQFPCQNSRDDFETRIYRSSNEPTRCRVQSENAQRQFLRELEGSGGNKNAAGTLPHGTAAHMAMLESMSSLAQKQSNIVIEMFFSSVGIRSSGRDWLLSLHQPTNSKTVLLNESHKASTPRVSDTSKTKDRCRALHCSPSATRTRQTAARHLQASCTEMSTMALANISILS